MDYPADFPKHLQPPVDAAIHKAETEFLEVRKKDAKLFGTNWQTFALDRIKTIFFAFGEQACEAGRQDLWSGEQIRVRLAAYLNTVASTVYLSTCPVIFRAMNSQGDRQSIDILIGTIHGSDEWIELQRKLRGVAESRSTIDNKSKEGEVDKFSPRDQAAKKPPEKPAKPRKHNDPNPELLKNPNATLSRVKAAEALGMSLRNFDRLKKTKRLPAVGLTSRKRYRAKDLLDISNTKNVETK